MILNVMSPGCPSSRVPFSNVNYCGRGWICGSDLDSRSLNNLLVHNCMLDHTNPGRAEKRGESTRTLQKHTPLSLPSKIKEKKRQELT